MPLAARLNEGEIMDASRRVILIRSIALAAATWAVRPAAAQAKATKAAMQYQDQPKNGQTCDTCLHWVPPAECKVVEGPISPKGWCAAYVKKS
jgi:anaerobic selenocysteine-containing dehydrogenase